MKPLFVASIILLHHELKYNACNVSDCTAHLATTRNLKLTQQNVPKSQNTCSGVVDHFPGDMSKKHASFDANDAGMHVLHGTMSAQLH
jgi:hypothetical protein